MKEFIDKLISRLEEELKLADETKEKCARENPLMFDNAKGYATGIANAKYFVNQLAEEYNNGWIPVSERLPGEEYIICIEGAEFYKHVLTTTQDENAQCCVGWYDQEDETWYDLEGFAYHPIAWQKLPAPYQPKGE